jgi:hypothetical protein
MRSYLSFAFLFAVLVGNVCAANATDVLANKFVELLRYDELYIQYRDQCSATYRTISAESIDAKNPEYFGGIHPGQKKWPSITAAYEAYFQEACARPTKQEFLSALSAAYSANLSAQQLQSAIDFYSSSTGQALVAAHRKATESIYQIWTVANSQNLADITVKFQRKIAAIIQAK